jgi:hypothetical protein
VFENRVLRGIFGSKRDGVTGEWRRLRNEELNDLHCSPAVIKAINLRMVTWAGHVARMGLWWGNLKERDHLKNLVVDGG